MKRTPWWWGCDVDTQCCRGNAVCTYAAMLYAWCNVFVPTGYNVMISFTAAVLSLDLPSSPSPFLLPPSLHLSLSLPFFSSFHLQLALPFIFQHYVQPNRPFMPQAKKRKTADSGVPSDDHIKDDKRWAEGDFELISSDNVRFKAPSYYLLAHR